LQNTYRFIIITQETAEDGKFVNKETYCNILLNDFAPETIEQVIAAGELIKFGNNQHAMEILSKLVGEKKVDVNMQPNIA